MGGGWGMNRQGISIHAPRGGSDNVGNGICGLGYISIHAPRGGSDGAPLDGGPVLADFNPRSPRGERPNVFKIVMDCEKFQSTLPAGGATVLRDPDLTLTTFQSTLPAGGATSVSCRTSSMPWISIHAPRGGSDAIFHRRKEPWQRISIHAPRGGSDLFLCIFDITLYHFNPRSPRGERHCHSDSLFSGYYFNPRSPRGERQPLGLWDVADMVFQSTLLAGGATSRPNKEAGSMTISIHAPRGGSDRRRALRLRFHGNFNPRSPQGERQAGGVGGH